MYVSIAKTPFNAAGVQELSSEEQVSGFEPPSTDLQSIASPLGHTRQRTVDGGRTRKHLLERQVALPFRLPPQRVPGGTRTPIPWLETRHLTFRQQVHFKQVSLPVSPTPQSHPESGGRMIPHGRACSQSQTCFLESLLRS